MPHPNWFSVSKGTDYMQEIEVDLNKVDLGDFSFIEIEGKYNTINEEDEAYSSDFRLVVYGCTDPNCDVCEFDDFTREEGGVCTECLPFYELSEEGSCGKMSTEYWITWVMKGIMVLSVVLAIISLSYVGLFFLFNMF